MGWHYSFVCHLPSYICCFLLLFEDYPHLSGPLHFGFQGLTYSPQTCTFWLRNLNLQLLSSNHRSLTLSPLVHDHYMWCHALDNCFSLCFFLGQWFWGACPNSKSNHMSSWLFRRGSLLVLTFINFLSCNLRLTPCLLCVASPETVAHLFFCYRFSSCI